MRVKLLAGGKILLGESLVPLQVKLGIGERHLILRLLGNGLIERGLIGPRVDLRNQVSRLDKIALLEGDLDDLAVDPAFDSHGIERLHRTETGQQDRKVGLRRKRYGDRNAPLLRRQRHLPGARGALINKIYADA